SMMLAAYPELVRPFGGVSGYTAAESGWMERLFEDGIHSISETGVLGDVTDANALAREAIFTALAAELSGYLTPQLVLRGEGQAGRSRGPHGRRGSPPGLGLRRDRRRVPARRCRELPLGRRGRGRRPALRHRRRPRPEDVARRYA